VKQAVILVICSQLIYRLGSGIRMAKRKLKIGDQVRVTGYKPGKYAPGVVDDMGTEGLFQSLVGRRYTIRGFDDSGNIELQPKRLHTVWIEPDLVKFVGRRQAP
jgi:hypothetical protein